MSRSVSTILIGLLSFMVEENAPTFGATFSSDAEKKALAKASWQFNLKNEIFCEIFPELVEELKNRIEKIAVNESKANSCKDSKSKRDQSRSNQEYNLVDFLKSCAINVVTMIGLVILLMFLSYILAASNWFSKPISRVKGYSMTKFSSLTDDLLAENAKLISSCLTILSAFQFYSFNCKF